jgi:hypothetical protein
MITCPEIAVCKSKFDNRTAGLYARGYKKECNAAFGGMHAIQMDCTPKTKDI